MNRVMLFLLSFYFGLGTFFSFIVAPFLFETLDRNLAGMVVERVFPFYFGIGLGAVGISLLIGITSRMKKFLLTLLAVNFIVLLVEFFYILPKAHALKVSNSPEFAKIHLISVIASVVSLFFTFGAIVYLIVKRDVGTQTF